jgi:hypothetical protein
MVLTAHWDGVPAASFLVYGSMPGHRRLHDVFRPLWIASSIIAVTVNHGNTFAARDFFNNP